MSIYPDRKAGVLTGRFAVEVQKGRKRLRGRRDSLAEAKQLEAELIARLERGDDEDAKPKVQKTSRPETFAQGIEKARGRLWHQLASEEGNFQKLETTLDIIGDVKIDAINTSLVDDLIESLGSRRGVSDATINRYLSALRRFLTWCKSREYRTVELPTFEWKDEDEGRIRWLSHEEEQGMIANCSPEIGELIRIACETGMRRSELLGLAKDQVQPAWVHLWETKNGAARSVPISRTSFASLHRLIEKGMPSKAQLRHGWDRAKVAIGLKDDSDFVFHATRHTRATRYVQANVNLRVIQKLMGHKRIETTLRYSHVNDSMLSDAFRLATEFHDAMNAPRYGTRAQKSGTERCGNVSHTQEFLDRKEGSRPPVNLGATDAGVAKLVDAPDLGSGIARCGGSSPFARTSAPGPSHRRRQRYSA